MYLVLNCKLGWFLEKKSTVKLDYFFTCFTCQVRVEVETSGRKHVDFHLPQVFKFFWLPSYLPSLSVLVSSSFLLNSFLSLTHSKKLSVTLFFSAISMKSRVKTHYYSYNSLWRVKHKTSNNIEIVEDFDPQNTIYNALRCVEASFMTKMKMKVHIQSTIKACRFCVDGKKEPFSGFTFFSMSFVL